MLEHEYIEDEDLNYFLITDSISEVVGYINKCKLNGGHDLQCDMAEV